MADPTRRKILERLAVKPETTGGIVDTFATVLVRTAVMKHLDVLQGAGLIRIERVGKVRWNFIERKPLVEISTWLDRRLSQHESNLDKLKKLAEEDLV